MSFSHWTFVFNFKDPATVFSFSLIFVHHDVMWYLFLILALVYWSLYKIVIDSNWFVFNRKYPRFFKFSFLFFLAEFLISFFVSLVTNVFFSIYKKTNFSTFSLSDTYPSAFSAWVDNFISYEFPFSLGVFSDRKSAFFSLDYIFNVSLSIFFAYFLSNRFVWGYDYKEATNYFLFFEAQRFHHSTNFEFLCASFPSIVILLILIPSTLLLYSLDEDLEPLLTYKVLGHQWFWSYEFNNWCFINDTWKRLSYNFDSSMLSETNLMPGDFRLLEVDNPLVVPVNVSLRFLITSVDVLHAWAVPELGLKIDATPGRLCHYLFIVRRPGIFYGQCSELCGVAHAFMPIVIKAL